MDSRRLGLVGPVLYELLCCVECGDSLCAYQDQNPRPRITVCDVVTCSVCCSILCCVVGAAVPTQRIPCRNGTGTVSNRYLRRNKETILNVVFIITVNAVFWVQPSEFWNNCAYYVLCL